MAEGRGMAKSPAGKSYDDYEVKDAMHTMLRAHEITKDKTLMKHVRKHAADHSKKMHDVARRAGQLAKAGRISDRAMAKMSGGEGGAKAETRSADKMAPIA